MVGGYAMIFTVPLVLGLGLPAWAAVLAAIAVCALVGMGTELIAYRPVRKKGTNMTALITAIAMSLFLENLSQAIPAIGPNPKVSSQIFASGGVDLGGVTLEYTTILTIVIGALVCAALYLFTQRTRLGRAMRCVSEDKEAATILGINVNHTILSTFAIGSRPCGGGGADVYGPVPQDLHHYGRPSGIEGPLSPPYWAASASCPAPCWAVSSLAWWSPLPPATSPPAWRTPSSF